MIEEQYVSFEVAKLLKEKGFDVPCDSYYDYFKSSITMYQGYVPEFSGNCTNHNGKGNHDVYSRPTQQLAMRWLREVHKLYVNVCPSVEGYYWTEKWNSYAENLEEEYPFGRFIGTFNSHEEACEAGIKYCLEHLIK